MSNKKIPVGLELYSVRNTLAKELEGTLAAVRSYGYVAVEFAGHPQYEAKRTAEALKANDLYCCSWHVPYDLLLTSDEVLKNTIEFHNIVGNKYLVIPGMPHEWMDSLDAIKATSEKLDKLSEKLAAHGMFTGYHNHTFEYTKLPGTDLTIWSALRENTNPNFIMQLDTGNALAGDADVNGELLKAAGRSQIIHLKPYSRKNGYATMIGNDDDDIDYNTILKFCKNEGGTHIYVIEYESAVLYSDLDGVRIALASLNEKFGDLL
ncbi:MAG: sugar phosphate isomerase/epimerase [Oscillospiraceae bacterium]|nr:sugar phosphate isomerase/epimerase [Oscillospiraceae bacterium]